MKKSNFYGLLFLGILLLACLQASAQDKPIYKINGNKLERQETSKPGPEKTDWSIDIKETSYPVFKSSRGSYYILRVSKKTGKEYKQYINVEEPKK